MKLNQVLGTTGLRLPTEPEWEYAARAGTRTEFSFSVPDDWDTGCGELSEAMPHMWWCGDRAVNDCKPTGQKQANPWGSYDMHGNVQEWVLYRAGSYTSSPETDPQGPAVGSLYIIRGGHFGSSARNCRSAFRTTGGRFGANYYTGFRLAGLPTQAVANTASSDAFTVDLRNEPLTGTIGIRDKREELWPLDGQKVKERAVTATPVGGGTPLSATVEGATYTFDGIAAGTYNLRCEVTYGEEVKYDNRVEHQGHKKGCEGTPLTKRVVVTMTGVAAPGNVNVELPRPVVMLDGFLACYETWFDVSPKTEKWDNYMRLIGSGTDESPREFISLTPDYVFHDPSWTSIANQASENIALDLQGLSSRILTAFPPPRESPPSGASSTAPARRGKRGTR